MQGLQELQGSQTSIGGKTMTKKDITETTVIILLLTVLTISFINPFSKKYTIWNLVYQTQDLYRSK